MTEAQSILKLLGERNAGLMSKVAMMYVDDPDMADKCVRELHEQTVTNMEMCLRSWGKEVVDRMIKYCGK